MTPRYLICLITDRHRLSPEATEPEALDRLVAFVEAAAYVGVDLIQIRERDLQARHLTRLTERCMKAVQDSASRVLVNDRVDVALAADAHGVHLRSDSIDAMEVRKLAPPGFTVGRSVHSSEETRGVMRRGGVDYLIFGSVFRTQSKSAGYTVAGLEEFARGCAAASVPVLAIGGIDAASAGAVVKAGAGGIAAIGYFVPPPGAPFDRHLADCVAELKRVFDSRGGVP